MRVDSIPTAQIYSPQKDHFRTAEPSILVGGPIVKEHLWFVAGFEPLISGSAERSTSAPRTHSNAGNQYFTQDRQQYFGYGRIDAALTQKIRVFGHGSRSTRAKRATKFRPPTRPRLSPVI